MAYYKKCKQCGANLDPGERCDCLRDTADTKYVMPAHHIGVHESENNNFDKLPAKKVPPGNG